MSLIVDVLKKNHCLDRLNFLICIVGSRKLSTTEGSSWTVLEPNLTILGFDADEDACILDNERFAEQKATWQERYIPLALSHQCHDSTLYVTKAIHCSSLYPPNEPYLARFMGMDQNIQLDFTVELETTTLDQFCLEEDIQEIDFLQVDVQGADLDVLRGGKYLAKVFWAFRSRLSLRKCIEDNPFLQMSNSFYVNRASHYLI
jgi:FkbM family methyltransferase